MPARKAGATSFGPSFPLQPTLIHVSDQQLSDLRTRLKRTRWPLGAGNDDWYYGVGRTYLQELVDYWLGAYDWRKAETAINRYEHYQVNVGFRSCRISSMRVRIASFPSGCVRM